MRLANLLPDAPPEGLLLAQIAKCMEGGCATIAISPASTVAPWRADASGRTRALQRNAPCAESARATIDDDHESHMYDFNQTMRKK